MTLLRDIQSSAIDENTDLPTLLRKCRVLASRLKNSEFKEWVQCELNGYDKGTVPNYRIFKSLAKGHFTGPFGTIVKNGDIPELAIPKEFRNILVIETRQGIGELVGSIEDAKEGLLMRPWPATLYPFFEGRVFENMSMIQAWTIIPKSKFVGILDAVRNKILNFVIEIEEENSSAGEASTEDTPIPEEKVNHIFYTTIYGGVANVGSGNTVSNTFSQVVRKEDFDSLSSYLAGLGIDSAMLNELKKALKEEKPNSKGFGEKVSSWLGKAVSIAANGGLSIAVNTASGVLSSAIMSYYGTQ